MKTIDAIKSLAELAFLAPGVEPLVVYDSVVQITRELAVCAAPVRSKEFNDVAELAWQTAKAIREADEKQFEFKELIQMAPTAQRGNGDQQ